MQVHSRAQEAEAKGQFQGQSTLCDEASVVYMVRHYVMGLLWSIW